MQSFGGPRSRQCSLCEQLARLDDRLDYCSGYSLSKRMDAKKQKPLLLLLKSRPLSFAIRFRVFTRFFLMGVLSTLTTVFWTLLTNRKPSLLLPRPDEGYEIVQLIFMQSFPERRHLQAQVSRSDEVFEVIITERRSHFRKRCICWLSAPPVHTMACLASPDEEKPSSVNPA
jgi:hypothetical protein